MNWCHHDALWFVLYQDFFSISANLPKKQIVTIECVPCVLKCSFLCFQPLIQITQWWRMFHLSNRTKAHYCISSTQESKSLTKLLHAIIYHSYAHHILFHHKIKKMLKINIWTWLRSNKWKRTLGNIHELDDDRCLLDVDKMVLKMSEFVASWWWEETSRLLMMVSYHSQKWSYTLGCQKCGKKPADC